MGIKLSIVLHIGHVMEQLSTYLTQYKQSYRYPEGVNSIHELVNKINGTVGDLTSFKPYFLHVCFPDN